MEHCFFYLVSIQNLEYLDSAGILISFVKLWCFMVQKLQGSSIIESPPLRGKQKLKIIIYDNFEFNCSTSLQNLIKGQLLVFFLDMLESLIKYPVVAYSFPFQFER